MVNIEELKPLIVEKLLPLNPDKIILFGSYAYGTPNEDSDVDLFIVKDNDTDVDALIYLRDIMRKYKIGFDILSDKQENIENIQNDFYKNDILKKGKVLYAK